MSSRSTAWIGLAAAAILRARPLQAQTIGHIDSQHPTARVIIASSARDARINVGVARLTGELTENGDRQPTAVHFQIYPADKNPIEVLPGLHALQRELLEQHRHRFSIAARRAHR